MGASGRLGELAGSARGRVRWGPTAAAAVALLAAAAGCASQAPERLEVRLPPVASPATGQPRPGAFVWVDLLTSDVAAARAFYGELFGWRFEGDDDAYVTVLHRGAPIAGMVAPRNPDLRERALWLGSLSVEDVDRAAAGMRARGGRVVRGPLDAPDRGRIALVRDPDGAALLLVRATGGDPPDAEPAVNGWLWRELWTRDPSAALDVYGELAGYEMDVVQRGGEPYRVLTRDGRPRAGLVTAPPDVDPLWLPWVRVEDAARTAQRAAELGARVVWQEEGAAIVLDPGGAPLGLQRWSGPGAGDPR